MEKAKADQRLQAAKRKGSSDLEAGASTRPPSEPPQRKVKLAATRRDGKPLVRDLFHSRCGHDFAVNESEKIPGCIKACWPKDPQAYPPGYAAATPPGFCTAACDCMDDQRPQKSWETMKHWLEDAQRTAQATASLDKLGTAFPADVCRRRGEVSKMFFFETQHKNLGDQTFLRAALDLAQRVSDAVRMALKEVSLKDLAAGGDEVKLPAAAFLTGELDYEPLSFETAGGSASSWAQVGTDDGTLAVVGRPPQQPTALSINLRHAEGHVGTATCMVTPESLGGANAPWCRALVPVVERFADSTSCQLLPGARAALTERFGEIWSFEAGAPRAVSLAAWLQAMSIILRMLRTAAVANIALGPAHWK